MSRLDEGTRSMVDERRLLERSWDTASGPWSDARRDEFEGQIVFPLVRAAAELTREMEATATVIQRALTSL